MDQPGLKLLSFQLCPFVQRSMITLEEKQVPYEIEYIDLTDKPAWFLELSPLGKVPVLLVGDAVLFESAVIDEYIDETRGEGRLHPEDPLLRAQNRAWIEAASQLNVKVYKLYTAEEEIAARKATDAVREILGLFERQIEGPLFNGPELALVDTSVAPALQRLQWCDELAPQLGLFAELPKIGAWKDALLARESVKRSTVPDIRERFLAYLGGNRGVKKPNEPPSWLVDQEEI